MVFLTAFLPIALVSLALILAVLAATWFIAKHLAAKPAHAGFISMILGAIGIATSLLVPTGYTGDKSMHMAGLIASAIVFGCGAIGATISGNK